MVGAVVGAKVVVVVGAEVVIVVVAAVTVEPVASSRLSLASSKASTRNIAASVREDSVSTRLVLSYSVQTISADATIYPPTVMTWGLAGNSRRMVTTKK